MNLRTRFGPWVIIAGASEGLGAAFATRLASYGCNLVLIARREAPLRALSEALSAKYGVSTMTIILDLGSESAGNTIAAETASLDVGLLVYNAAAACISEFSDAPVDKLDSIIAVNCSGLVRVVRGMVPRLIERSGGLILMSSMSGFRGHACAATYAASKAFTTSLGEGLWAELEPQGVTVRVVAAGATNTPNFLSVTPEDKRSAALPMGPEEVADAAIASLQRSSRWGALVIPGILNRIAAFFMQRLLWSAAAVAFMSDNLRKIYSMPARQPPR